MINTIISATVVVIVIHVCVCVDKSVTVYVKFELVYTVGENIVRIHTQTNRITVYNIHVQI